MIYLTADQHFGHRNIIDYCNRPFRSVEAMDECLIAWFNEVVADEDLTYHLGDLCYGPQQVARVIPRLHGGHILIPGNHDVHILQEYADETLSHQWNAYEENYRVGLSCMTPKVPFACPGMRIALCHYPLDGWDCRTHGVYHFHGHSHGRSKQVPGRYDVGVDNNNYRPISLPDAIKIVKDEFYLAENL